MIKKIYQLLFLLFCLIPVSIKADCTLEEKIRLKALASNIDFSYSYVMNDNDYLTFNITITNLHPDLYIYDNNKLTYYYHNKDNETTISGYDQGSSVRFDIISNYGSCKGEILFTNYVALPHYNRFYKNPLCQGIEEHNLCKKWNLVNLGNEEFETKIKAYKKSLEQEEEPIEHNQENDVMFAILDFIAKYNIYIFGGIIVIGSGLIFYLKRKDDFDLSTK